MVSLWYNRDIKIEVYRGANRTKIGICERDKMDRYIIETPLLDYTNFSIQQLVEQKKWKTLDTFECIKAIYDFVRDDILFGYNIDDNIPASKVLSDGYGQIGRAHV